ncbi:hypothetical protein BKA56DRAFT_625289 [Ilyonectria sp. MPI-CAGE-AT-0026]|nr:hypothetical protein BKA56DRAFT_625289 [Ilyonectria sp. MPI-CAGE-AT-0026]
MDSSLSTLLERLRGRTPGSTVSSLGLKTYNDIFGAANWNTNAAPRESHSTVQPSISDGVPDVQPVGLALWKSHSTVQPSTPGDIPETVPIDPALEGSQSTGQSRKPGGRKLDEPATTREHDADTSASKKKRQTARFSCTKAERCSRRKSGAGTSAKCIPSRHHQYSNTGT